MKAPASKMLCAPPIGRSPTELSTTRLGRLRTIVAALVIFWLQSVLAGPSIAEEILYEQRLGGAPDEIPLTVQVGNQSVTLALDTGNPDVILDPSLRPKSVRHLRQIQVGDVGPNVTAEEFDIQGLRVGAWKLPPDRAWISDFTRLRNVTGVPYRGFLGIHSLLSSAIEVNYDEGRLRFTKDWRPPDNARLYPGDNEGDTYYLPFTHAPGGGTPVLNVNVADIPLRLKIVTGSNLVIGLAHEHFEELVKSRAIAKSDQTSPNVVAGRYVDVVTGKFTRGDFLGLSLNDQKVIDCNNKDFIGMQLLSHFNFVIDFPGGKFFFAKRKLGIFYEWESLGLDFRYDTSGCYVDAINPHCPGPKALQIRLGDSILKLGPLSSKEINKLSVYDLCSQQYGQSIDIEFIHKGEHEPTKGTMELKYPDSH
jgi:hypothetical protein